MPGTILIIVTVALVVSFFISFSFFAHRWHKQDDESSSEHCCGEKELSGADERDLMGQPGLGDFSKIRKKSYSGIPDIGFGRAVREISEREKPSRVITDHELAIANETMKQMGRNEF